MFLCVNLSICLSICFFGVLWVGSLQRKKLLILGKDLDHIIDTKKIMNFQRSYF